MDSIGNLALYNDYYRSLRETLVPLDTVIRRATATEILGDQLITHGKNVLAKLFPTDIDPRMYYSVPYPYSIPVYHHILQKKGAFDGGQRLTRQMLNSFTDEEIKVWTDQVYTRIMRLVGTAIHEYTVNRIDENHDIGCVVHLESGIVEGFDYTNIAGIELTVLSYTMHNFITHIVSILHGDIETSPSTAGSILENTSKYRGTYDLNIRLTAKDADLDMRYRTDPRSWINFDSRYASDREQLQLTIQYIADMVANHAKCLVVP